MISTWLPKNTSSIVVRSRVIPVPILVQSFPVSYPLSHLRPRRVASNAQGLCRLPPILEVPPHNRRAVAIGRQQDNFEWHFLPPTIDPAGLKPNPVPIAPNVLLRSRTIGLTAARHLRSGIPLLSIPLLQVRW